MIHQKFLIHAAVLEKIGFPLKIYELALPDLLPGQVLVKLFYSGVCRSQLMEVRGGRGEDKWLPHLLGHEGSGQVIQVGEGVTKVCPGDEVILGWIKGAGMDAPGAVYKYGETSINSGRVTTFSNYTIASESRVTLKPKNLPFDEAVLFGCALPTGSGMVLNELQPQPNSTIAVIGLGGIGLSALIAIMGFKCQKIIAIDISEEKITVASEIGATKTFNARDPNLVQKVFEYVPGGVDYCIESAGTTNSIELGFSLIRKNGGKLLFASHPPEGDLIRISPFDLISGKNISGSWGGASLPERDIPLLHEIVQSSKISLKRFITKKYSLHEINEALNDLESGQTFRPLIQMEH